MKVVLFCGGLGMRLREYSEHVPKPMVPIGYRPIIWHLMKYYAHYGHKEFILCLGYKADTLKNYFLNYNECISNDFVLSAGGKELKLLNSDIQDWKISFIDTGVSSNIGQRLRAVEEHLQGEEVFLANYSDGLTDLPLSDYVDCFMAKRKIGSFICVRPKQSFHVVEMQNGIVSGIRDIRSSGIWLNGGYFIFRKEIFKYIRDNEELVQEPFQRLIQEGQLTGYQYDGFWAPMDTFKDKQELDDMYARGDAAWEVWKTPKKNAAELVSA